MTVLRSYKLALVLSLSLVLIPEEALSIIVPENGKNCVQNLRNGSDFSKPKANIPMFFMHSRECGDVDGLRFRLTMDKLYPEARLQLTDRSYKLNFAQLKTGGKCWSCLGTRHLKLIQKNKHNNYKKAHKVLYENYKCSKHEDLLKLLMDQERSGSEGITFVELSCQIRDRAPAMLQDQEIQTEPPRRRKEIEIFNRNGEKYVHKHPFG